MSTEMMNTQLAEALSKAQGQFPPIPRDKTVTVQTKTGGTYKFSYAPLETIMNAVRPALSSNGIAISQKVIKLADGEHVRTELLHSSGEVMQCDIPLLIKEQGPQAYGSALTYARRYSITLLLCVAADDDDDGNAAEGNGISDAPKSKRTFGNGSQASAAGNRASGGEQQPSSKGVSTPPPQAAEERIDKTQAKDLHMAFRAALKQSLQAKAEGFLSDYLTYRGYIDADGKASTLQIPKALYQEELEAAEKHAREL